MKKVLPGVVYFEMAQAAVREAYGETGNEYSEGSQTIALKNVVWVRPITVKDKPFDVNIGLFYGRKPEDIAYEIYTENSQQEEGSLTRRQHAVIHSQGVATLVSCVEPHTLNLADLQQRLNQNSISPHLCYNAL